MKKAMLLLFGLLVAAGATQAADVFYGTESLGPVDGPELQPYYFNSDRTLSADTLYTLRGQVYFEEGTTLSIPAGTIIQGEPAGTIIIKKGAQIFVNGTAEDPVIFTSSQPAGLRTTGDWGGIVVLGRGPINLDPETTSIEGGIIEGTYGGDEEFDNSGVIKYCRLEFPGYRFEEGNEINGLTMGGVGAGTELHHVQVSHSNDDAFEWFGGNVDAHHLVAVATLDDDFDVDDGYTGRWQFMFGLKYPDVSDLEGSTLGMEHDSRGALTPLSFPVGTNMTLVGPERIDALVGTITGTAHLNMIRFRENTKSSMFNSVMVGHLEGIRISDDSIINACNDDLRLSHLSVATTYNFPAGPAHEESEFDGAGAGCTFDAWFNDPAKSNIGYEPRNPSTVGLTNLDDLFDPQPQPLEFSELDGTADFSDSYLADVPNRLSFDTTANYRGAFVPGLPMDQQWTAGWTEFDPNSVDYVVGVEDTGRLPLASASVNAYPNPFNPATTLKFSVPRTGHVNLTVYDVSGRVVRELHAGELAAGQFTVDFDGNGLASGTYFARLQGNGFEAVQKMQLVK